MTKIVLGFLVFGSFILGFSPGCASSGAGPDAPVEKPKQLEPVRPTGEEKAEQAAKVEFASCKDHLETIGDCFFKVVTQIGREPREGEPMARFLGEATRQIAAADVHEACVSLGLTEKSTHLILGDGSEVTVENSTKSRDEMADGTTVWHIIYHFSSPTCPDSAKANIELWMGGPK